MSYNDCLGIYEPVPAGEIQLEHGNYLTTIEKVDKEFYLGFDLFITKHTPANWRSIVHLTVGANLERDGDRIPGIWLTRDNNLYVASSISGNKNSDYKHNNPLKEGVWYRVEIEQILVSRRRGQDKVCQFVCYIAFMFLPFSVLF